MKNADCKRIEFFLELQASRIQFSFNRCKHISTEIGCQDVDARSFSCLYVTVFILSVLTNKQLEAQKYFFTVASPCGFIGLIGCFYFMGAVQSYWCD